MQAYMKTAKVFADCSVGVRLKVGTVIVKDNNIISVGYNALPAHIHGSLEDVNGKTKPEVRHSEKNALMALTKSNQSSIGATLFCTHAPCRYCSQDEHIEELMNYCHCENYKEIICILEKP